MQLCTNKKCILHTVLHHDMHSCSYIFTKSIIFESCRAENEVFERAKVKKQDGTLPALASQVDFGSEHLVSWRFRRGTFGAYLNHFRPSEHLKNCLHFGMCMN